MTGRDSKVREQGVGSLLTKIKYYILLPGTVANNVVFLNSFSDFFFEKKKRMSTLALPSNTVADQRRLEASSYL